MEESADQEAVGLFRNLRGCSYKPAGESPMRRKWHRIKKSPPSELVMHIL